MTKPGGTRPAIRKVYLKSVAVNLYCIYNGRGQPISWVRRFNVPEDAYTWASQWVSSWDDVIVVWDTNNDKKGDQ